MKKLSKNLKLLEKLIKSGVIIVDPESTFIDSQVKIGKGSVIFPNTFLLGKTKIGTKCEIGPGTKIDNCQIGSQCLIDFSVVEDSILKNRVKVGPYAHIRPNSELGDRVNVGSFAETKKAKVGAGSTVPHLAYLGDAEVGKNVNFSCGAITVNYDGKRKHKTIIEDNVMIGAGVNLIAPLKVQKNAFVAAGSTVRSKKPIPGKSLVIARTKDLYIKKNWKKK